MTQNTDKTIAKTDAEFAAILPAAPDSEAIAKLAALLKSMDEATVASARIAGLLPRTPKAAKPVREPRALKAPKTPVQCACGCGKETMGSFAMGHDAKVKGIMKRLVANKALATEIDWKPTQALRDYVAAHESWSDDFAALLATR